MPSARVIAVFSFLDDLNFLQLCFFFRVINEI